MAPRQPRLPVPYRARGNGREAIVQLRASRELTNCLACGRYEIAQAFEAMRLPDSALAAFVAAVETPPLEAWETQLTLPLVLRRLGEMYEAKENKEKALEYYGRFVALWKNAEAELQPAVADVTRRIAKLVEEPRRP